MRNDIQDTDVQLLKNWLEVHAKTYDNLHNQFPSFNNAETSTFSSNAIALRSSNVISSNPQASKTNEPENFNQYRTKRKQFTSCKNGHNIMQCPQYSSSTPPQRYNIAKLLELCVNSLIPHHLRTNCVSNNRCQECNGFHHTSLHDPNNLKKSTFVVNAHHDLFHKTMHPILQEPVLGSKNGSKPAPQETRKFNQQSADFNRKSKEYKHESRRFSNPPDLSRYGAQHSNRSEHQLPDQNIIITKQRHRIRRKSGRIQCL